MWNEVNMKIGDCDGVQDVYPRPSLECGGRFGSVCRG